MKIYIEERGWGMGYTSFMLYTINNSCEEGHGILYNSVSRTRVYTFAWCHPCEENELPDDLKRKFMYSFKHGSHDIEIKTELLKDGADLWDILRNENNYEYTWVSQRDAEIQKKIEALEINTKEDVLANKDLLFNNPVSHFVVCKVLVAFGIPQTVARNGEIGIAAMQDFFAFSVLKESIINDKVE